MMMSHTHNEPMLLPPPSPAAGHRATPRPFSALPAVGLQQQQPRSPLRQQQQAAARGGVRPSVQCSSSGKDGQTEGVVYNKQFGYSRKDVLLIGAGLIAFGYALYYGLQALGVEPGYAGNFVQMFIFLGICVGWVSTYVFRVATKVGGWAGGSLGRVRAWRAPLARVLAVSLAVASVLSSGSSAIINGFSKRQPDPVLFKATTTLNACIMHHHK